RCGRVSPLVGGFLGLAEPAAAARSDRRGPPRARAPPGPGPPPGRGGPATSAVSVLVIDWTTTGAPPPTVTPPTSTATDWRRSCGPASNMLISLVLGTARAHGRRQRRGGQRTDDRSALRHHSVLGRPSCGVCVPQGVHAPLISITGDFGVKPAARAADRSFDATSADRASPTVPHCSQMRNTTSSPAAWACTQATKALR